MDILFWSGVGLGVAVVASPGAVTAQAIRRGLDDGFIPSLILQLGAVVGLVLWAIVALVGITILAKTILFQIALGVVGSGLLLYLAGDALRAAYIGEKMSTSTSENKHDFVMGTALSLANPLPMILWLGIANDLLSDLSTSQDYRAFGLFLGGFIASALLWSVSLSGLLVLGRQFISPTLFRAINFSSAIILGLFAAKLLWNTFSLLG